MAITISGQNNNDKIVASDGVLDMLSGFNVVGVMTASSFDVGSNIKLGNAGIITATTVVGNVTGNLTGNINHTSNLLLQISGSEKFRVGTSGQFGIAGANYGTSGQVLTSGGSGSAPTWSTITGTTINNNADNRIITGSGTANTLEGEANLTFDGTSLDVNASATAADSEANTLVLGHGSGNYAGMTLQCASGYPGSIFFTDTDSGNEGRIVYNHNQNELRLFANGSQKLVCKSDGVLVSNGSLYLNDSIIHNGDTNTKIRFPANDEISMEINGNERFKLSSIGYATFSGALASFQGATFAQDVEIADTIKHSGDTNTRIRFPAADTISFQTNGSERARIDSSGNMGLGVVPNANWPSNGDFRALQIGTGAALFGRGSGDEDRGGISVNAYHTGSAEKYIGNGHAARIYLADGNIDFDNAGANSSGADAALTLNTRMRISADGKVGINKTNPSVELEVRGTGTNGQIYLGGTGAHSQIYADNDGALILSADQGDSAANSYAAVYVDNSEVARFKNNGNCGFGENNPQAPVDAKGSGVPMVVNSTNSNTFKIQFKDNGTVRSAIGANSSNLLDVADSSGNSKFAVTTPGVAYNGNTSTHGSGVYMCEVHTDLLKLLKSSQNHPNTTGNYYSWSDGGTASWSWDNGVLRMDSNVGSHTWQCGSVYLTPGYYTLMQCWRACEDAHGWGNFGSSSNGNQYTLTDDAAYGSYNTLLTSYSGQHSRTDGKSRWFSTTTGNFWHHVSSAGTYRIQQMGQPYGSGGYKYYILAAYLLKLK